jgi:hypothetical protein
MGGNSFPCILSEIILGNSWGNKDKVKKLRKEIIKR